MRATPVAVHLAAQGIDETMAAARVLASITHGDPAAGWGAALLHAMIAVGLDGDDPLEALPGLVDVLPTEQRERFAPLLTRRWSPAEPHVPNGSVWGCLAEAVWAVRSGGSFADIVGRAIDLGGDTDTVATVAGALAGVIGGVQSIPSRWLTYLHGWTPDHAAPDGVRRRWNAESLQALTAQLLGAPVAPHAPPPAGTGPRRIAAGLHAADLTGALATAPQWAVVSLCRVGDAFAERAVRRQVHLVDGDRVANPGLDHVLADVLDTIDAFHDEGREVVVHCHHGGSRTGFVLRAWLIRRYRWDEPTATAHLRRLWPLVDCWNPTFTAALRRLADGRRPAG
jgi:ADP-ribosyl-[dinitrogen reductase] hydrolase